MKNIKYSTYIIMFSLFLISFFILTGFGGNNNPSNHVYSLERLGNIIFDDSVDAYRILPVGSVNYYDVTDTSVADTWKYQSWDFSSSNITLVVFGRAGKELFYTFVDTSVETSSDIGRLIIPSSGVVSYTFSQSRSRIGLLCDTVVVYDVKVE